MGAVMKYLRLGVDVNATDNENRTALIYAASDDANFDVCRVLLEFGADKFTTDDRLQTAWHIASQKGFTELAALLSLSDNNLEKRTRKGKERKGRNPRKERPGIKNN